jgi:dual specificity MAP kinase phosphatase
MCEWSPSSRVSPRAPGPTTLHLDFNKKNGKETSDESDAKTAPVEILPFLFLGNESHCASREVLEKLGVTAVMNVSKTINNHFQGSFLYKNVPVDDSYNADISRWFRVAVDFIGKLNEQAGPIFARKTSTSLIALSSGMFVL